ncbi:hypothetical protein H8356DRAFT_1059970 [Neocallimastix lanati (nom. inval.)]|nr:hypothetical protein H8356DRAFT_1059970 [Neocallimastix sp. JGI-2020a]
MDSGNNNNNCTDIVIYKEEELLEEKKFVLKHYEIKFQLVKINYVSNIRITAQEERMITNYYYGTEMNEGDFKIQNNGLLKLCDNNIQEIYDFFLHSFNENKISIKDIKENISFNLIIKEKCIGKEYTFEISLKKKNYNNNDIIGLLCNKMNELEIKNINLDSKVNELEEEKNNLNSKVNELETKNDNLNFKVNELEEEKNNLNSKVNELEEGKNNLNSKVNKLEEEKNKLNSKVNELEEEKNNLNSKLNNDFSALENKNNILEEKLETINIQTGEYNTYFPGKEIYMRRGHGERSFIGHIDFNKKYESIPYVLTSLSALDAGDNRNIRISVNAFNITTTGFDIKIYTWADTSIYYVRVSWISFR